MQGILKPARSSKTRAARKRNATRCKLAANGTATSLETGTLIHYVPWHTSRRTRHASVQQQHLMVPWSWCEEYGRMRAVCSLQALFFEVQRVSHTRVGFSRIVFTTQASDRLAESYS